MYPPEMTAPMSAELENAGFSSLKTTEDVEKVMSEKTGTTLLVINSVCGCAAGSARPGIINSLSAEQKPDNLTTVFAGVDGEATRKAREYLLPYPPSSPCIALFKDGELVHLLERHHIKSASPEIISANMAGAYKQYC